MNLRERVLESAPLLAGEKRRLPADERPRPRSEREIRADLRNQLEEIFRRWDRQFTADRLRS